MFLFAAFAALTLAGPLAAQSRVLLELRPSVGDTIRMRVEQETEVLGQRVRGSAVGAARSVTMSLRLWSRAIVQGRMPGATTVLTITDSVRLSTTDPQARDLAQKAQRTLAGRVMRLQLSPDGTARVMGREEDGELSAVVAAMPAALPPFPVGVGDRWRREMPVPGADPLGAEEGVIRAVFRLDSLSRDGARAWISIKGELSREPLPSYGGFGPAVEMHGTLTGAILLDRRRGWLDDARFILLVLTSVVPARGSGGAPMYVTTKITQRMRVEARAARP